MVWFYEFLHWLTGKMEEPHMFGWFHLMMIAIVIATTALYIILWRKADEKTYRKVIFWSWIVLVALELLKQLTINFVYNEADPALSTFEYYWDHFPFQFCAVPLYTYPLVAFLPNKGKVSSFIWESLVGFTACFITIGGLATLIYPEQALIDTIVINIQTLTYHGLMIVVGIYTAVWLGKRFNLKIYSKSPVTFIGFVIVAMILNITFIKGGIIAEGTTFNMFFISPYFPCTLPVLSAIYPVVPYPVFLLLYILGFIALGFVFFEIIYWILWLIRKLAPKTEASPVTEQQ